MNPLYPEIVPIRLHGRVSSPHHEIHTGRFSAVISRTNDDYVSDQSNYSPKFSTVLHFTGQDIFHTWIDRSSFRGRNTSIRRNHHTDERGWKSGIFQTFGSHLHSSWLHFSDIHTDVSGITWGSCFATHIYGYVVNNCNIETRCKILYPVEEDCFARKLPYSFSHGMTKPLLCPQRSPGWERIKRE